MAADVSALKEYLVKLGWDVDELGFSQATSKLDSFSGKLKGIGSLAGTFTKAGTAFFSFIASTNGAMIKLLNSTAQADLAVERFARKMWTTEENARSFLAALDVMDASYEDIFYMTPEEYNRFLQLKSLASELQAPAGLQDSLKTIRDIGNEANKTKLIVQYATQWVVYYLTTFMGGDLDKIREKWGSLNNYLMDKLPVVTEKIAKFFYYMYRMGKTVIQVIADVKDIIQRLFSMLSSDSKKAGAAIAGFVALFSLGPIGAFIAALTLVILLLDDFFTWQRGGKSHFGEQWQKLADIFEKINGADNSRLEELGESLDKILTAFWDILEAGGQLFGKVWDWADDVGILEGAFKALKWILDAVANVLEFIADMLTAVTEGIDALAEDSNFKKFWDWTKPARDWVDNAADWIDGLFGQSTNSTTASGGSRGGSFGGRSRGFGGGGFNSSTYENLSASTTAASATGLTRLATSTNVRTLNQTNNVTVNAGTNASPQTIADKTAAAISANRGAYSAFV